MSNLQAAARKGSFPESLAACSPRERGPLANSTDSVTKASPHVAIVNIAE